MIYCISIRHPLSIELSVASPNDAAYFEYAFPEFSVVPQVEGDLGCRMAASFQQAFRKGAQAVVLTGSDIPGLNNSIIKRAFSALEKHMGVIGPASDGGYYLIGMRSPGFNLFNNITWSTQDVLMQTEKLAHEQNLNLIRLPTLKDMDDSDEYWIWRDKYCPKKYIISQVRTRCTAASMSLWDKVMPCVTNSQIL